MKTYVMGLFLVVCGVVAASLLCQGNPASAAEPTITAGGHALHLGGANSGKVTLTYDAGKEHPYVEIWQMTSNLESVKLFEDDGDGKGTLTVDVVRGNYKFILTDFGQELATYVVIVTAGTGTGPITNTGKVTTPGDVSAELGVAMVNWGVGMMTNLKAQEMAAIAAKQYNKQVGWSVGDGQCTRLVEAALGVVGAKPGSNYVWGRPLKNGEAMRLGDVIQFTNVVIQENGTWKLGLPNHTAIVAGVNGSKVSLLHQNLDGEPAVIKSRIRIETRDFAKIESGSFIVYRPQK